MIEKIRIGIYGGSFNPIHNAHIALGTGMLGAMSLREVWYMVSPQNPLKQQAYLLPEEMRLHLTELALEDYQPRLRACSYEFGLPRPSYTWHTLQRLQEDYPNCEFVLIIGGDNWAHFHRWRNWEDIVARYEIAVFPREGAEIDESQLPRNVHVVHVPLINISSTMVRERLRQGEDVSELVPPAVVKEIQRLRIFHSGG